LVLFSVLLAASALLAGCLQWGAAAPNATAGGNETPPNLPEATAPAQGAGEAPPAPPE